MNIYDDITLIYVSYKSDLLFKKNINIIKLFKTIIVDNFGSDDLFIFLKDYPKIKYFKNTSNLGFGAASNLGVKKANTPYVILLNPDIIFDIKSIEDLYKGFLLYDNAGVAGPSLYKPDGLKRSNSSLSYIKKKIYRNKFERQISKRLSNNLSEGNLSCDYIIGCSMIFNKSFFLEIGGFDENFFMYYEDNDICDRVKFNNKLVLEIPLSKMSHLQGKSTKNSFRLDSTLSIIHKISEYKYLKKNVSLLKLFLILLINTLDFSQRFVINLLCFKFKNSYKNFLRLISVFLYITGTHLLINFLR
tara:strand:+ start:456 stop:1364 length:909 start_codon:yes stop_codon:yes gene_type:complete